MIQNIVQRQTHNNVFVSDDFCGPVAHNIHDIAISGVPRSIPGRANVEIFFYCRVISDCGITSTNMMSSNVYLFKKKEPSAKSAICIISPLNHDKI